MKTITSTRFLQKPTNRQQKKVKISNREKLGFFLSSKQKKLFLLIFTRELIRNSGEGRFRLEITKKNKEKLVLIEKEKKKHESKTKIKNLVRKGLSSEKDIGKRNLGNELQETKNLKPAQRPMQRPPLKSQFRVPVLRIPKTRLPPQFQYLKPVATGREIDLGELNPFINDPAVREIEIQGPNQNMYIEGEMGRQATNLILRKEEIDEAINRFSQASKIPTFDGIFKVVVGRLIFSAVISEEFGSRFSIRKMSEMSQRGP